MGAWGVIRDARVVRPGERAGYMGESHGTRGPGVQGPRAKLTGVRGSSEEGARAE